MDWTTFYLSTAGAAATLMGLLFIGVQFRLGTHTSDTVSLWPLIARSTFSMYLLLFVLPMIFLIPTLSNTQHAAAVLVIALFGTIRAIATWLPIWHAIRQHRERLRETAWLLIGPLATYLGLAYFAFQLNTTTRPDDVQTNIAFTLVVLFSIVIRNSWNMLVELPTSSLQ